MGPRRVKFSIKRSYKPKRKYKAKKKTMPLRRGVNMGLGFPKQLLVKQRYRDTILLTSTAGALSHHHFNLNNLFDPDRTGTGHSPMYFKQYMNIYNHYTVLGAKMSVKFFLSEGNSGPIEVCLWQNDDAVVTPVTMSGIREQSKAKQGSVILNGNGAQKTLSLFYSTKKTFGGNPLSNFSLRGDITSGPPEASIGSISFRSTDSVTTQQVWAAVSIDYVSMYNELKDLIRS